MTVLSLQDVHKRFGPAHIIRGVTLDVPAGERHAVIGPNGAGKSTLFNLISGRLHVSSGAIKLNGMDVTREKPQAINRRGLARSFQVTNIFPRLSVYENIRCGVLWSLSQKYSFWRGIDSIAAVRERTDEVMESVGLKTRRHDQAGVLTYAEQRALEIGITIAGDAKVILLDEPMAGMSRSETERAVALIKRVTEGKTLLMVEHDMGVVFDMADKISVLVYGQLIASDVPMRIRENAAVREAYLGEHA